MCFLRPRSVFIYFYQKLLDIYVGGTLVPGESGICCWYHTTSQKLVNVSDTCGKLYLYYYNIFHHFSNTCSTHMGTYDIGFFLLFEKPLL